MGSKLKDINQISIYLKSEEERVNEIALSRPLDPRASFTGEGLSLHEKNWSSLPLNTWHSRCSLLLRRFVFKHLPLLVPPARLSKEAKFKTVVAILLSQESLREFFLSTPKKRENFFASLQEAARAINYSDLTLPQSGTPYTISQQLTSLDRGCLIDNSGEFHLQMAALPVFERDELLFSILNRVERPPITSVLEVMHQDRIEPISLTTQFAKYQVLSEDPATGVISYIYRKDEATSSLPSRERKKGACNQRCVFFDSPLSFYSGELTTESHLLEQIFFILGCEGKPVQRVTHATDIEVRKILFTSLYSWNEYGVIVQQREAIRQLNHQLLKIGEDRVVQLELLHFNVPFNAFNKYPAPAEMKAALLDLNDEALIPLLAECMRSFGIDSPDLFALAQSLPSSRGEFFQQEEKRLVLIDEFRLLKRELIDQLEQIPDTFYTLACRALLEMKKPNGKRLKGIDHLLYLNLLAEQAGYTHSKNCKHSLDRCAGADAADKAQFAYTQIHKTPYLPGFSNLDEEHNLFKVLYSMYLVWEEPEFTTALSTGFLGEKFYDNVFQRNPETTRYLLPWLKKHPEIYLGLSKERS